MLYTQSVYTNTQIEICCNDQDIKLKELNFKNIFSTQPFKLKRKRALNLE